MTCGLFSLASYQNISLTRYLTHEITVQQVMIASLFHFCVNIKIYKIIRFFSLSLEIVCSESYLIFRSSSVMNRQIYTNINLVDFDVGHHDQDITSVLQNSPVVSFVNFYSEFCIPFNDATMIYVLKRQ